MNRKERQEISAAIRRRFAIIEPYLTEQTRRVWVAAEALAIGTHGSSLVAQATGISRTTIRKAQQEFHDPSSACVVRQRRPGGGRKPLTEVHPRLRDDLERLLNPLPRDDGQPPLRWTCKSTYQLAEVLQQQGHTISQPTVYRLLARMGYCLQSDRQAEDGTEQAEREAQFEHLYWQIKRFQLQGQPVIWVDAKNEQTIATAPPVRLEGDFQAEGESEVGSPGFHRLTLDQGWVSVGIRPDTASFAVVTIRDWWRKLGREKPRKARKLLITATTAGSHGDAHRLWKVELQKLATKSGLRIHFCHFPPGISKWNTITKRLFSFLRKSEPARPPEGMATIVHLIGHPRVATALSIDASLEFPTYEPALTVSDEEMARLKLEADKFHGEWNYRLAPT